MLTHKGTQQLETRRLILRGVRREDAQARDDNWASEEQVTKYLTWPTYPSVEPAHFITDLWAKSYEKEDFYQWMIVPKELGQPIGTGATGGERLSLHRGWHEPHRGAA